MKLYFIFSFIQVVLLYTTFAKNIQNIKRSGEVSSKSKRDETSDECKYINSMIHKDESFNCCELNVKKYYTITCENGHITEIVYPDQHLSGTIPESIGKLTHLKKLWLHRDNFSGPIPESIGNLTNLKDLRLSDNHLSSIPESIGNLSKLEILELDNNEINGIPESIGKLTQLTDLILRDNKIKSIPDSIGKLTHLEYLHLSNNYIRSIPESVKELLPNIENFDITNNCIDCSTLNNSEW
ncbi:L domain-like protein [Anaeromyces robustus]|uniref:L domain-like protein n=1 Tax=Anaeromyces robustus TaxID=1754192 RepID=A0A1Y1X427_9FUNG|nr:L domain-like protein [Anaeromyces robustus]|eukprot:ORX80560.1 L domain-like protein [Anaeromyces robustus]